MGKEMRLISHRGNIDGPDNLENHPDHIKNALKIGYDVEIDIWNIDGVLYLGHDAPEYNIRIDFINKDRLWIHCKNVEALEYCKSNRIKNNYFWHQNDDVALTSNGFFWTYPGKKLTKYSIAVMPEIKTFENINISCGICSDYIKKYQNK